jgi:hypothetical protein
MDPSFKDYLREVHLSLGQYNDMSQERQDAERDRFIGWLTAKARLQPVPAPAPPPGIT